MWKKEHPWEESVGAYKEQLFHSYSRLQRVKKTCCRKPRKVLLLGCGLTGKATLLQQVVFQLVVHTSDQLRNYQYSVHKDLVSTFECLKRIIDKLAIPLESETRSLLQQLPNP